MTTRKFYHWLEGQATNVQWYDSILVGSAFLLIFIGIAITI